MKEFRDQTEPGEPGAVEEDVRRIRTINGREVLGYDGFPSEEHSGAVRDDDSDETLEDDLADNRPRRDD